LMRQSGAFLAATITPPGRSRPRSRTSRASCR
jgi:hypothetical protein